MGEKLQHTEEHNDMPKKGLIFKFEEGTDNLKGIDRIEDGKYIEGDKLPENGQIYTFKEGSDELTQIETIKKGKVTETEILTGSQIDRIKLMVREKLSLQNQIKNGDEESKLPNYIELQSLKEEGYTPPNN